MASLLRDIALSLPVVWTLSLKLTLTSVLLFSLFLETMSHSAASCPAMHYVAQDNLRPSVVLLPGITGVSHHSGTQLGFNCHCDGRWEIGPDRGDQKWAWWHTPVVLRGQYSMVGAHGRTAH